MSLWFFIANSITTKPNGRFKCFWFLFQEVLIEDEEFLYGAESGWVEARTSCDHLASLSSDLVHIPTPETPCNRSDPVSLKP